MHSIIRTIKCGGSIYSENVVITAAHCCDNFHCDDPSTLTPDIVAGDVKISDETMNNEIIIRQQSRIKAFRIHPGWKQDSQIIQNDICLLYLETPLDLTGKYVRLVELATEDPLPETNCTISGWGAIKVVCS